MAIKDSSGPNFCISRDEICLLVSGLERLWREEGQEARCEDRTINEYTTRPQIPFYDVGYAI